MNYSEDPDADPDPDPDPFKFGQGQMRILLVGSTCRAICAWQGGRFFSCSQLLDFSILIT